MKKVVGKTFVLDTNVILHDSGCLTEFGNNDVVIPITVLEELDNFKKGNEAVNFHARQFVRSMDALRGDTLFEKGVQIGPKLGRILVRFDQSMHPELAFAFSSRKPDHQILNTAFSLMKDEPDRDVILMTKDVNLRMKARSIGVASKDYTIDHIQDVSDLYLGRRIIENLDGEIVQAMYEGAGTIPAANLNVNPPLLANEYLILRNGRKSALATYLSEEEVVRHVDKRSSYGIRPRNSEQTFALEALLDPERKLVTLTGKAGTGKTLLALAAALENRHHYSQMLLARPIVPLSNKDIGFLPGDIQSKLGPYMQPLYDNLGVIRGQLSENDERKQEIKTMLDDDKLVISPLSYIRGRSLVDIFFIVDEAQNLTPHEIKTIITRAGEGTKMVFTGDVFQIDHPYLDSSSNGLSFLIEKMKGNPLYAHVTLEKGERSELAELASNLL